MVKAIFIFSMIFSLSGIINGQTSRKTYSESVTQSIPQNVFSESKPFQAKNPDSNKKYVPTAKTSSPKNISNEDGIIKIDSTLVMIPVSVSDPVRNLYVTDITKEEFKVFEDGIEQKISYFGAFDKPFTVILLLDTSPSTRYKIEEIQAAARYFVDQLKPQDRVEIIKFNEKIRVLAKATKNREKIYKAIEKARFDSGTSLYDVVDFALEERLKNIRGRKAIVLFTDGVDTTSETGLYDDTVKKAEESDTTVFPVYYDTLPNLIKRRKGRFSNSRGERPEDHKLGKMYLEELAASTGGRVISPETTAGGLNAAFKTIAEELSYQYNIGYYPQNEGRPGQRKKVSVRIYRPDLNVRARDNYIVKGQ
jgi:Ca-activated chloride channel family protein